MRADNDCTCTREGKRKDATAHSALFRIANKVARAFVLVEMDALRL